MNNHLLDIIACPSCKGKLEEKDRYLICQIDRIAYPIKDGIPVLLVDQAKPLGEIE